MRRKYFVTRDGLPITRKVAAELMNMHPLSLNTKLSQYAREHPGVREIPMEELMVDRRLVNHRIVSIAGDTHLIRMTALAREFGVTRAHLAGLIKKHLPSGDVTEDEVREMWRQYTEDTKVRPGARRHMPKPATALASKHQSEGTLADIWNKLYGDLEPKEGE